MYQMATYGEHNGRNGLVKGAKELGREGQLDVECSPTDLCRSAGSSDGGAGGVASFTTNHNSVVCLPLVSEGLKLVWTQSDQTRELDAIPELVQAFNLFPYPSSHEVNALARLCALPLDKVKVWFMVQRIKYGISWSSEEIEETRRKLAVPQVCDAAPAAAETNEESNAKAEARGYEEPVVAGKGGEGEAAGVLPGVTPQMKKPMCESPDSYKPSKPSAPCFSSSLPPPQDSYFYRSPAIAAPDVSLDLSESSSSSSSQRHRHGRYKKSKVQLAALRKSFLRENWPAEAELRRLQEETGLSRNDIRKWFSDSRYQLRVGRGSLAAAHGYSQHAAPAAKHEQQSQPLPLTIQKHRPANGARGPEAARSNGVRNAHFFQTFLSHSLEAFGERVLDAEGYDGAEELSGDGDSLKDEDQGEEQPLQLTKTCKPADVPDAPQETSGTLKSCGDSSPSGSPPPPPPGALPNRPLSKSVSTAKKSAHSAKCGPSQSPPGGSSSTSPSLTPAGRPRKTKGQLDVLKQHFLRCQWPKSDDYTDLVKLTGLPRADVIQWFGDTRYAVKNGQLRWVKGVRDQFLALAAEQSGGVLTNGSGAAGMSSRAAGSRKRKSQAAAAAAGSDSPDVQPLIAYYLSTGLLHEKDLDSLCKRSRMSYQQVREWFAAQDGVEADQELIVAD